MQDSLYVIRSETENQYSALSNGSVCSCREDLRINLAQAFWIFWSCKYCKTNATKTNPFYSLPSFSSRRHLRPPTAATTRHLPPNSTPHTYVSSESGHRALSQDSLQPLHSHHHPLATNTRAHTNINTPPPHTHTHTPQIDLFGPPVNVTVLLLTSDVTPLKVTLQV